MTLQRVISGGQTGVDQAALFAAEAAGLSTGGWGGGFIGLGNWSVGRPKL